MTRASFIASLLAGHTRIARDQVGRLYEQIAFGPRVDSTTRLSVDQVRMGFSYKRSITVDHTKVAATLSNFPMLVSFTHNDLRSTGNGGHVQHSSGYDVCFFSDEAGTSALTWEMERYNAVTGEVVAWVKIPSLSSTVDTAIWMHYGDPTISTFQSTPTSVWDSSYKGVYHLGNGTTLNTNDSTINANHLTNNGNNVTATAGAIDGAGLFNFTNNTYLVKSSAIVSTVPITLSAWVKSSDTTNNQGVVTIQAADINHMFRILLFGGKVAAQIQGGSVNAPLQGPSFSTTNWFYVVGVFTGSEVKISYNGGAFTTTASAAAPTGLTQTLLGISLVTTRPLNGSQDETRISNVERTAAEVATNYANQSSFATFATVGAEQAIVVAGRGGLLLLGVG